MAIVNFSIPKTLEKRIDAVINKKGFATKAEFFRFSAFYFMDLADKPFANEDARFHYLVETIRHEVTQQLKGKQLPSTRKRLADI